MFGNFFIGVTVVLLFFIIKWSFFTPPEKPEFTSEDAARLADLEKDLEKCIEALEMIHAESDDDKVGFIACSALDTLKTYDWGNT